MLTKDIKKELSKILPSKNYTTELEQRYVYSFDAWANPEEGNKIADAVIFVENTKQIQEVIKFASNHKIPVICRGAGTNTVGSCVPSHGGIILDFARMNKILELNKENMTIRVQAGVTVGEIQTAAESVGLFFPPDPSNLTVSTIGGGIAQNSSGARCLKYGGIKNYVLDLLVVTSSGETIKTGSNTVKNAAGYDLNSLFTGSEGTLGIISEALLKLIPKPEETRVIAGYFNNIEDSVNCVNKIIGKRIFPSTIDFMDKNAINTVEKFYPAGLECDKDSMLLIEADGDRADIDILKDKICSVLKECGASDIQTASNKEQADKIWKARRSSMAACAKLKPNVTTDDIIVPRENLAELVKGVQNICKKHNLTPCLVGHVGDGSIHPQIPIDFSNEEEYKEYKLAKTEMYELAVKLNGTISGEHGIGLGKRPYLSKVTDTGAIEYMRQIKKIFDPNNILNPYKIF